MAHSERDAEAAHHTCKAVHAQQERRVNEAQQRRAEKTPARECELAECEHEARARVADARALVDEVVDHERSDAHLGTPREQVHVHVTGLRDKAEYAAVLLVEGRHVRGGSAVRGS